MAQPCGLDGVVRLPPLPPEFRNGPLIFQRAFSFLEPVNSRPTCQTLHSSFNSLRNAVPKLPPYPVGLTASPIIRRAPLLPIIPSQCTMPSVI